MQRGKAWRAGLIYMAIGMLLVVAGLLAHAYRKAVGLAVTFTGVGFVLGGLLVLVAAGARLRSPHDAKR